MAISGGTQIVGAEMRDGEAIITVQMLTGPRYTMRCELVSAIELGPMPSALKFEICGQLIDG